MGGEEGVSRRVCGREGVSVREEGVCVRGGRVCGRGGCE